MSGGEGTGRGMGDVRRTRHVGLGYVRVARDLWRVVDRHEGDGEWPVCVGPLYRTRGELLEDLDRYAREAWGY